MNRKPQRGKPLYDAEMVRKILEEAEKNGGAATARKYGFPETYITRWKSKLKARNGAQTAPTDSSPAGEQPKPTPRAAQTEYRLVQGVEDENRRLKEALADLMLENKELQRLIKGV